jgi:glycerol-3-phosphate cytidylyltransferase-like family protein
VVALAPDDVVLRLKNRAPNASFNDREATLRASGLVDEVMGSDKKEGTYKILEIAKPDIVVFGYDQTALALDFLRFLEDTGTKMPTKILEAFAPERYKSSLMRSP